MHEVDWIATVIHRRGRVTVPFPYTLSVELSSWPWVLLTLRMACSLDLFKLCCSSLFQGIGIAVHIAVCVCYCRLECDISGVSGEVEV